MRNIKTIIFDFGGIILNIDYYKTSNAFNNLGVAGFDDMYSQKNADPLFSNLEEGKLNEEEFYESFRRSANLQLTNQEIEGAWNAMLLGYRKEALDMLKSIKHKYRLFLLSNTNIIHQQAFNKIYTDEVGQGCLADYFDKIYYSHEIGFRKPNAEAYEYVLKENNLSPAETLFIDDSIQNINAASALGVQTVLLKEGMGIQDLGL
jgi:putative hydrolase of the HAD superfamily